MKDVEKQDISELLTLNDEEFWDKIEERNEEIPDWEILGFKSAIEYSVYREIMAANVEADNIDSSW